MQPQDPPTFSPSPGQLPTNGNLDFILNPQKPSKPGSPLSIMPATPATSLLMRVIFIGVGLIVLIIIFSIIKGLVSGGTDWNDYITVAQDQQELIHIVSNISQQQGVSTNITNFASTASLALSSSQTQLITYLNDNHQKVSTKLLNLKVSAATDSQLSTSAAAGTYNQTLQQVLSSQLSNYYNDMTKTYSQTKGTHGHYLLNSDLRQAKLLYKQLLSPTS